MPGFFDKLRNLFRKKPTTPKRQSILPPGEGGHRGIAAGDLEERRRLQQEGLWPYAQEEMEKWKPIPADEVEAFMYEEQPMFVHSTNVAMAQYFLKDQKLLVEFKNGSAYIYSNISESEALKFAQSPSKGDYIWTICRIRGTKKGHKKPYLRVK